MPKNRRKERERIAAAMTALAHPRRVAIFNALNEETAGLSFEDLMARTDLSIPTFSRHLRPMKAAKLVVSRRKGPRVIHRIDGEDMLSALSSLCADLAEAKPIERPDPATA